MRKLFATFVLLLSLSYGSLKHIVMDRLSGLGIIGGSEVAIKEVPFMAIVCLNPEFCVCGGFVVGEQHVITAAHCCDHQVGVVKVGTDRYSEGGQLFSVNAALVHPKYDGAANDVCVLKLQDKLSFSETVDAITMADKDFDELTEGDLLQTIGFGVTEPHGKRASEKLMKVSLPYMPNKKCNELYKGLVTINETMLCAGGLEKKGVCFGDSGSPIYTKTIHNNTVIGITSFGADKTCDQSKIPAVFARISALRPFIDEAMKY